MLNLLNTALLYTGNIKDPDRRNYVVSSERLRLSRFEATTTLGTGIEEIINALPLTSSNMSNV